MKVFRVAIYCLVGGLAVTPAALGTGGLGLWWLAGILFSASFVPVALFGPRGALAQFRVIAPVFLVVTVVCLWSEALIFMPAPEIQQDPIGNLVAPAVMYTILAIVLAATAALLKLPKAEGAAVDLHPAGRLVLAVLFSGLAYVLYYLVFGAITYEFFTKGYYPDAPAQVEKLGLWFWALQLGRGVLMTLAVVPIIRTLRMGRMQAAIAVGLLLWVTGGAAPLLLPNPYMGATQRFIHTIEILTQNASLGITAVLLLRRRPGKSVADMLPTRPAAA